MSNADLIRHLRAEHSKHYDALGDLLFDAARALEAAEAERTYFDEDTLRKVYDALDATSMPNVEIENAINAMQNAGILFRERVPESTGSDHANGRT